MQKIHSRNTFPPRPLRPKQTSGPQAGPGPANGWTDPQGPVWGLGNLAQTWTEPWPVYLCFYNFSLQHLAWNAYLQSKSHHI